MGLNFFDKIIVKNAKKFYENPFSVETMAVYVYIKRDLNSNGSKYVIERYFKKLTSLDNGKYKSPIGEVMDIEGVFDFCLTSLHFSMSQTLSWVGDVCDLMINGTALIFNELKFTRV